MGKMTFSILRQERKRYRGGFEGRLWRHSVGVSRVGLPPMAADEVYLVAWTASASSLFLFLFFIRKCRWGSPWRQELG